MQSLMNFIGHTVNSLLLVGVLILILDMVIRNYLSKSGKDISNIPSGDIILDASKMILPVAKKFINIEDKEIMQKVTIAVLVGIVIVINIFLIR